MDLKFYFNKFLKADNIEGYTLKALMELKKVYEDFKEKTEGLDPDFPEITFGDKGTKISRGTNITKFLEEDGSTK